MRRNGRPNRTGYRALGAFALAVALACVLGSPVPTAASPRACTLSAPERQWAQTILDGWDLVTRRYLRVSEAEVPWIVLFDTSCVWHVAPDTARLSSLVSVESDPAGLAFRGRQVPVYSAPHDGSVRLPTGSERPADPAASASVYETGDRVVPYFILALPEIWRRTPGTAEMADVQAFFAGVAIHEMVHTLQLAALRGHIDELEERYAVPERLDDDVVQRAFEDVSEYRELFERERETLRAAAAAADPTEKTALVRRAIRVARDRRGGWFTGEHAAFSRLEDLFLNMEGVAVWSHAKLHEAWPDRIAFEENDGYWTQEEGYLLFLLLDDLVPDWRTKILSPKMAAPFDLLEAAVRATGRTSIDGDGVDAVDGEPRPLGVN